MHAERRLEPLSYIAQLPYEATYIAVSCERFCSDGGGSRPSPSIRQIRGSDDLCSDRSCNSLLVPTSSSGRTGRRPYSVYIGKQTPLNESLDRRAGRLIDQLPGQENCFAHRQAAEPFTMSSEEGFDTSTLPKAFLEVS